MRDHWRFCGGNKITDEGAPLVLIVPPLAGFCNSLVLSAVLVCEAKLCQNSKILFAMF